MLGERHRLALGSQDDGGLEPEARARAAARSLLPLPRRCARTLDAAFLFTYPPKTNTRAHAHAQIDTAATQVYPRAMWPPKEKIVGLGLWGGVVVAGGLYLVQPFDYAKKVLGLTPPKKE